MAVTHTEPVVVLVIKVVHLLLMAAKAVVDTIQIAVVETVLLTQVVVLVLFQAVLETVTMVVLVLL
jgi:hypothetical protein